MNRFLLVLIAGAVSGFAHAQPNQDVWATAISERPSDGRRVIFRYLDELREPLDRTAFPFIVVLSWRYDSNTGMPTGRAVDLMYRLEDLLAAKIESSGQGRLVLISTGENVRLWTYYARSERDFRSAISATLIPSADFPIEVSSRHDPTWAEYDRFRRGVQRR